VQLDAFADCQLSVTVCPTSIWVWLAVRDTETIFAALAAEVLAGACAGSGAGGGAGTGEGVLAVPEVSAGVEFEVAAVLEVGVGVLAAAVVPEAALPAAELPDALCEVPSDPADTAEPLEPPPPHAVSTHRAAAKHRGRDIKTEDRLSMVLFTAYCKVFDFTI